MAFNGRMHPRNIYKTKKPDFKALASKYEQFRRDVEVDEKGKVKLDFKNPAHLRSLTWALLKDDFDLDVTIPLNRLIPTVPLRLNYILWIEDIFKFKGSSQLHGIDLGCGSSCIYSLLGAKKNSWKFLAAEADSGNYETALKNIKDNDLTTLINLKKVSSSSTLDDVLSCTSDDYDFSLCNPPFFESSLDAWGITNSRSDSRPEPNSKSTASELESIYPGGEVEFVKKVIIQPSLKLRNKVTIYTTMLGKKSSVKVLLSTLKENGVENLSTTEFCQGNTMRWGLAWTFDPEIKLPECPKQPSESAPLIMNLGKEHSVQEMKAILENVMDTLKIKYLETETEKFKCEMISWSATAYENMWIHQRRKRRKMEREFNQDEEPQRKKMKTEDCCEVLATGPNSVATEIEVKPSNSELENDRNYVLHFDLNLTNENSNKTLKFIWKDGDSKDLLHQVFQYFKNYFENNKYLST